MRPRESASVSNMNVTVNGLSFVYVWNHSFAIKTNEKYFLGALCV